jgi:hypothetical protein
VRSSRRILAPSAPKRRHASRRARICCTTIRICPVKSYTVAAVADRFLDGSGAVHAADTVLVGQVLFTNLLGITVTGGASELRTYATAYPVYSAPIEAPFNQTQIALE